MLGLKLNYVDKLPPEHLICSKAWLCMKAFPTFAAETLHVEALIAAETSKRKYFGEESNEIESWSK